MSMNQNFSSDMVSNDIVGRVVEVVADYVSCNTMPSEDLPSFMNKVYDSLQNLTSKKSYKLVSRGEAAVPINESITPNYLICLEDGKRMKMLKRHLRTAYGMSPEDYRSRWGLPHDYPMVAPNYAKKRRSIALNVGLGKSQKDLKRKKAA